MDAAQSRQQHARKTITAGVTRWIMAGLLWPWTGVEAGDVDAVERCRKLSQSPAEAIPACTDAALAVTPAADPETHEEMLFRQSDAELASGDFAAATRTLDRVALLPAGTRWMHDYRLARRRGILAYRQHDATTALTHFQHALALAKQQADTTAEGQSRNDLGNALRMAGRYREALEAYTASLSLKRQRQEKQLGALLNNIGDLQRNLDDFAAAHASYAEALAIHEQEGRTVDVAHTLESLGTLALDRQDLAAAGDAFRRAQSIFVEAGARAHQLRLAARLARLALDRNDTAAAQASLAEGRALVTALDIPVPADLALQQAREALTRNAADEAEAVLAEVLPRLEADAPERVALLELNADAAAGRGDAATALRRFREFHAAERAQRERAHDQRLTALRVQFEVAEKDRALEHLAAEHRLTALSLRQRNTQLGLVAVSALAGFALVALGVRRTRERSRIAAAEREARLSAELEHYRRAAAALEGDARWVQALLDRHAAPVVAVDARGDVVAANAAATAALARPDGALVGASFRQLLDPANEDAFDAALAGIDEADAARDLTVTVRAGAVPRCYDMRIAPLTVLGGAATITLSADDAAEPPVVIDGHQRLEAASASLSAALAANEAGAEAALRTVEHAADALDAARPASRREEEDIFRRDLVDLMLSTVAAWEQSTGKTTIDLAEKSRAWRITIDNGRLRVRALERYLSLAKLPRQPRWREVLRTAYYVLAECRLEPAQREQLKQQVETIQADLRRRALLT
ncbi:tetratricopeptide repeat protein [Tahibacter amnicola]|uniref:Tetratricopeptide repeat protein n=1 Tax=Tahibacter amnicola TaxID=2976241 RepID=A0ABY6BDJ6_9GAMM|nr:tetratricopeptide repeat protein [Tahibacter amnicola]UXI68108.1 tetratricopeptide repeat protein [Tahibacter amnicola]